MVKEYFSHDVDALGDIKIVKMMQDYDFTGFGWYWAIVAELCKNGGKYEFSDLGIMAKCIGVKKESLTNFIDKCIHNYTYKEQGLFSCNETTFWSDSLLKRLDIRNKRREAAKNTDKAEDIKIDGIEFVRLTEKQFKKLVELHGEDVILAAIKILDDWLAKNGQAQKGYIGRNNYGHFRKDGWVLPLALKKCGKEPTKPNWSI
jgi:hypothetical protein